MIAKKLKKRSFGSTETSLMEKCLLNEVQSKKTPTLVSAKLLNYTMVNNADLRNGNHKNNMQIGFNNQTSGVLLDVDKLAYTNSCLILDDENFNDSKNININKNDSIV